jgi:hypothetical protein
MQAFAERAKRAARARIAKRLAAEHEQQLARVRPEAILHFADNAIDRAGRYGILGENHVYVFAEAMLRFGRKFDEDPRFRYNTNALRDEELSEEAKAALIRFWLAAHA